MKKINQEILNCSDPEKQMRLIVKHYAPKLYSVIRPIVHTHENADDVLQETLLKIFKNIKKFRSESKLYTWMYRIAYNESLQFLRKNKNMFLHKDQTHEEWLQSTLTSDPWFDGDEAALKLESAIESLPSRRAEVFRLKYFGNLKYGEIAEILGLSVGALKAHYHLAVKDIKNFLTGK